MTMSSEARDKITYHQEEMADLIGPDEKQGMMSSPADSTRPSTDDILKDDNLLESQLSAPLMGASEVATPPPPEYRTPYAKKLAFLGVYFALNLGLTLSNKAVMQRVSLPECPNAHPISPRYSVC